MIKVLIPRDMKQKVLIVDDNDKERKEYVAALKTDFFCIEALDGLEGLQKALETKPDMILTDACMPKMGGFKLCELIKQTPELADIPVLICTSVKTQPTDQIAGFNIGAEDYLVKPVDTGVLLARIKAKLRKKTQAEVKEIRVDALGMTIDISRRIVFLGKKELALPKKEFEILVMLVQAEGRIISASAMLETVWGYDLATYNDPQTVKTHISSLNKRLGGKHIKNVRGVGYKFD